MRKKVFGRHLSRGRGARKALFRSQVRSLVEHGSIKTTEAKAKSIQSQIDKLMKKVRVNSVASKRAIFAFTGNDKVTTEGIFAKYSVAANQRNSGFTRIVKLGVRKGDSASYVRLEMVDEATKVEPSVKQKKVKAQKVTKTVAKKVSKPVAKKTAVKKAKVTTKAAKKKTK
ncbi:50S ribosomal protein L17 [Candidatus Microgenomates bacterium]|nr:50S ribosomal protein L17 [Candidatus Microgenomates bacterium]